MMNTTKNIFKNTSTLSISRYISDNNMKNKSILIFGNISGLFGYYRKQDNNILVDTELSSLELKMNINWFKTCLVNNCTITIICNTTDFFYWHKMRWFLEEYRNININNIKVFTYCWLDNIENISAKKNDIQAKSTIKDIINMGRFDVCIMNAPYAGKLHEKFESAAINMVNDEIVFVGPLTWAVGKDGAKNKDMIAQCDKYHTEMDTINPAKFFDANIGGIMGITYINKKVDNNEFLFNGVTQVDKFNMGVMSGDKVISKYYNMFNFENNIHNLVCKTSENIKAFVQSDVYIPAPDDYIIRVLPFSGQSHARSKNSGEFYGIFSNSMNKEDRCNTYKNVCAYNKKNDIYFIPCPTKTYAENLWDYLHTDFSMLIMYMYKTNLHIDNGQLSHLPTFDFSEKWDDLKLFKHFGFTKEEVEHIYNVIPNYYNNDRKYVLDNYEK